MAKLAVAALVLGWFVRYAYLRITTPPTDTNRAWAEFAESPATQRENDATEEMTDAIAGLPALPVFNSTPPVGVRWSFPFGRPQALDLTDVSAGVWDPAARPHLRMGLDYLVDPVTDAALEQIGRLRDRAWGSDAPHAQVPGRARPFNYMMLVEPIKVLVAHARYRHADQNDIEGAWEDLKTVLVISRDFPQRYLLGGLIVSNAQSLCLTEIVRMLQEVECTESLLREMDVTLASLASPADAWIDMRRVNAESDRIQRAGLYTDDGCGNGWLVLSEWTNVLAPLAGTRGPSAAPQDRSRIWNVASVLFNDRRTVEAKADRHQTRMEELAQLPYAAALARVEKMENEGPTFNLLDGPQIQTLNGGRSPRSEFSPYQEMLHGSAAWGAARIVVALKRYRAVHGRIPDQLAALAPEFIPAIPLDPFSGLPYPYRPEAGEFFRLYSWGRDGVDNGGQPGDSRRGRYFRKAHLEVDIVYTSRRPDPLWEPRIESIPTDRSSR